MFDFGFSELVVVFVVALVVLGPTRLPGLVRKVGRWVGKARSMAHEFRTQLENEVNVEELNRAVKRTVMDEPPPPPPPPAEAGAATPAEAGETLAGGGYPYGAGGSSSRSADPAVTAGEEPQSADDTYSHAHAPDGAPLPWSPEDIDSSAGTHAPASTDPATREEDAGMRSSRDA
ncbi:MAG TPA: Sec-independent protein translocase protein TatB [Steroidobacteraceae bacterium]|nr:Sec-independent protein translocase protein TatB [Steroidobacteraceae bacterium]